MSIRAETSFSLKDDLFNAETVGRLAEGLAGAQKGFQRKRFERRVLEAFPALELKARIDHMVDVLSAHLPDRVPDALEILYRALPAPLDPELSDDDFGSYIWVVPGEYAARHGCNSSNLAVSLNFLSESTKRFSAECAIRPFLHSFPRQTLAFARKCTQDSNYHVRRLASEGTRPLLPWAMRVKLPVAETIRILDILHSDTTRYVTRSVANHLNDLAKTDPSVVVETLQRWQAAQRQNPQELEWMVRHSLRTLIKRDDPSALALLGYPQTPEIRLAKLQIADQVKVGEELHCRLNIESVTTQKLLVTLRVFFLKANGGLSSKVFNVTKSDAAAGQTLQLSKKISFRPMTTRVIYPGTHRVEVVVNGTTCHQQEFELVE